MSSTPKHKLFSSDVPQTKFVSDGYQRKHSDSSDIKSNDVYTGVGSCDDTHAEHGSTSTTYCENNGNNGVCILSTSTDTTYSAPSAYLETCIL